MSPQNNREFPSNTVSNFRKELGVVVRGVGGGLLASFLMLGSIGVEAKAGLLAEVNPLSFALTLADIAVPMVIGLTAAFLPPMKK